MLVNYKANVGDEIWTIVNSTLVFGKVAQVSITICPTITINYVINTINQALIRSEEEIFLDLVDALMKLSDNLQDISRCHN